MTITTPDEFRELSIRETIAHIDQMHADIERTFADRRRIDADHDRKRQEIRYAPWIALVTVLGGAAAFFAAGVAFVKVLGG